MVNAKFTIKNYRCFSDEEPLVFTLHDGFIAFVGPNNSGKSSILKFFFEFRNIWSFLLKNLDGLIKENSYGVSFNGVTDNQEIFHRHNGRNIYVELEVELIKLIFTVSKVSTNSVNIGGGKITVKIAGQDMPVVNINMGNKNFTYSGSSGKGFMNGFSLFNLLDTMSKMIYIPSFRNVINIGADASYYDISVGSAFIETWHQWKVGSFIKQNQKIQDITNNIKELFGYSNLEINASPQLKTLQLVINNSVYKLHEIGSGISQFILVFASVAIKEPSFILIDEPELNLHPALQQKFLTNLTAYSKNGVLFATHSIGLARSVADHIYSVKKDLNCSSVKIFEKTPNYAEFLGELSYSTLQEVGFDKILLVEGPTDVRVFQQFLRAIKEEHNVLVLNLGGATMINGRREYELAEIKKIANSNNIFCWIDSEKTSEKDNIPKDRNEFIQICNRLGFKINVSEKRATENYLADYAVKETKGEKYNSLKEFEKLQDSAMPWSKEENWLIARKMKFEDIEKTDLGVFLLSIKNESVK